MIGNDCMNSLLLSSLLLCIMMDLISVLLFMDEFIAMAKFKYKHSCCQSE